MTGNLKSWVIEKARAEGFDAVAIAPAAACAGAGAGLTGYLAAGYHGEMSWMARTAERRADPLALWPEARTAIVCGLNYGPEADPLAALARTSEPAISVYARGHDYHDLVKKKLKALARPLAQKGPFEVKVFVDTAPLMEKPLAQAAGLGWQGKHTNLVSRAFGSWLFLGAVLTTAEIEADEAESDHCGQCRACLDICPTDAFPAPYRIDARRCISYLTIEHRGTIARAFRKPMANRIYGCDDCLAVCPWNKFAQTSREAKFAAREALAGITLADLAGLDDPAFRALFTKSPIKRTGRDRMVRNVMIALGNSGDEKLAAVAEARLGDAAPLVRAMSVWALGELAGPREALERGAAARERERDNDVLAEWRALEPATVEA